MASDKEFLRLMEYIKENLLSALDSSSNKYELEKQLLIDIAKEAAFVGFLSEIGICSSNTLVAINSRLQKQSTTAISLQLGSCINVEFQTLINENLKDINNYKILTSNGLDKKMRFGRKIVQSSEGRIDESLWCQLVEFDKQKTKLYVSSVMAKPFKYEYEKNIIRGDEQQNPSQEIEEEKNPHETKSKWPFSKKCKCVNQIIQQLEKTQI
nr:MAG: wsv133-like protein [Metapenaeopsis lamellata majanivirus]